MRKLNKEIAILLKRLSTAQYGDIERISKKPNRLIAKRDTLIWNVVGTLWAISLIGIFGVSIFLMESLSLTPLLALIGIIVAVVLVAAYFWGS